MLVGVHHSMATAEPHRLSYAMDSGVLNCDCEILFTYAHIDGAGTGGLCRAMLRLINTYVFI